MNPVLAAIDAGAAGGVVDLRGLRLRELPDEFPADPAIRRVDLSGNRLAVLPPSLLRLPGLRELDLANNRLATLPDAWSALPELVRLDASENRLTTLPPAPPGLRDLLVCGNALTDVPAGAFTTLDISGNRLGGLANLPATLESLDASGNRITALPDLLDLPALRRLDLSGNRLTSVDVLRALTLDELHLDGNLLAARPGVTARFFTDLGNPYGDSPESSRVREAVRAHTTGHADPGKQYFDTATLVFAFTLAISGTVAVRTFVDHYYKRFKGVGVTVTLADGTRIELTDLSRSTALKLVDDLREPRVTAGFPPVKAGPGAAATAEFVTQSIARLGEADLVPAAGPVIHFRQVIFNGEVTMGDQINIGSISGSNVNIKSRLTRVTQTVGAAATLDDTVRAELNQLVEKLAAALDQLPAEQARDGEAVAETAADLVEKATQEKPNKRLVDTIAGGLKSLAEGLGPVVPVVAAIVELVTKITA
ncbi:leucine-rich repeat domain-containing protein [Acrocarpospora catenulata]|uniref:leucine-rich repeat domain-containing protein n=1 Tax=Acrocarpospora catenulata TaxID=2836182 RepID=UPI001BD98A86|nr:leucine-rich repeat domain-containing protein [Acrocarpospora catenulata]